MMDGDETSGRPPHRSDQSGAAAGDPRRSPEAPYHPAVTRLLVDAMLGKLATYLRMCGYDAAYVDSDFGVATELDRHSAIRARASRESRTILTRDRALAGASERALPLESRDIESQLGELVRAGLVLRLPPTPQRCGACNTRLTAVAPADPTPAYAPPAAETDVWRCPDCCQHFWKGSHWADVAATLSAVS